MTVHSAALTNVRDVQARDRMVAPSAREFTQFQVMIEKELGIFLPAHKITLLNSRLAKRVLARECGSFGAYYKLLHQSNESEERQLALDLMTTNETYFFREIKHFEFLQNSLLPCFKGMQRDSFRVWSAACSSGEEPYSIAMLMQSHCPVNWEIFASDISTQVLQKAERGIYPNAALENIPKKYRHLFCRQGTGPYLGQFRIAPSLRACIDFCHINLNEELPNVQKFDVIFLRNILIYFEKSTQARLLAQLQNKLKPDGYLFLGHSESLHGVSTSLKMIRPAIYQLPN